MDDQVELRALRTRLVTGALSERRRIERVLHDGLQQDLVAVSVRLQLLRELLATEPSAVPELLDELQRDVRDALDRLQTLASDIYPPILAARGLSDALCEAARGAGAGVRIDAAGLRRYPTETEAAAYFACRALLDDVQPGASVTLVVRESGGELRLEVTGAYGVDRTAVEDLVGAAGGTLGVESTPGGTRLRAVIPLHHEPDSAR